MVFKITKQLFLWALILTVPCSGYVFKGELPYPPQSLDFVKDNVSGFHLLYDYISDKDSEHGIRKELWNSGGDTLEGQFSFVLGKETELTRDYDDKKGVLDQEYPSFRWAYENQVRYTTVSDLKDTLRFRPLGEDKCLTISANTDPTNQSKDISSVQIVAVDEFNQVLRWLGKSWGVVSQADDHSHMADVAFIKIRRDTLGSNEAAARTFRDNAGAAGAMAGLAATGVGAPFAAIGMGIMAIVGATRKYHFHELEHESTRFFALPFMKGFAKHATVSPAGQVWLIGSDLAPYWAGHDEKYKHFTSKDIRAFFPKSNQRIFDISAGEGNLAVINEDGVRISNEVDDLSVWIPQPAMANSLVDKMAQTAPVPGGASVVECGLSPEIVWAVSQNGGIYELSSFLDSNDQMTWQAVPTPQDEFIIKTGNASDRADASGRAIFINKGREVYLLVDGQNWVWRKLEKLKKTSSKKITQEADLIVRDAVITEKGSLCMIAGGQEEGGQAFFATPEQVADLGSPLSGIYNKDLVAISVGKKQFLCLNPGGELTVEDFESEQEAYKDPACVFAIFRQGDIFALKGSNGKWLSSPDIGTTAVSTISASEDDSAMDESRPGLLRVDRLEVNNMQFVADKVPELRNPDNIRVAAFARNNGGYLTQIGKFVSSIDPSSREGFKEPEMFLTITKVQDNSQLPIYIQTTETIPHDSVRVGMYMQLLRDYMDEEVYEYEFFPNMEEIPPGVDEEEEDRTIIEIIKSDWWPERVPSLIDDDSTILTLESIERLIDRKTRANEIWHETDALNLKRWMAYAEEIFTQSEAISKEIKKLSKKMAGLSIFRATTFSERAKSFKDAFDELRARYSSTKAEALRKMLAEIEEHRVWGEADSGNPDAPTELDEFSSWLISQAARSEFLSGGDQDKQQLAKKLEEAGWNLVRPIGIQERLTQLARLTDKPFLMREEQNELSRQVSKVVEAEFISRLTPDETKGLVKALEKIKFLHQLEVPELLDLQVPTLLESTKALRERLEDHVDEDGLWDSSLDGYIKNALGVPVSYSAYTVESFFDDVSRLNKEVQADRKARKLDNLDPSLKWPLWFSTKQVIDSITKGDLGREADYSKLADKARQLIGEL